MEKIVKTNKERRAIKNKITIRGHKCDFGSVYSDDMKYIYSNMYLPITLPKRMSQRSYMSVMRHFNFALGRQLFKRFEGTSKNFGNIDYTDYTPSIHSTGKAYITIELTLKNEFLQGDLKHSFKNNIPLITEINEEIIDYIVSMGFDRFI